MIMAMCVPPAAVEQQSSRAVLSSVRRGVYQEDGVRIFSLSFFLHFRSHSDWCEYRRGEGSVMENTCGIHGWHVQAHTYWHPR